MAWLGDGWQETSKKVLVLLLLLSKDTPTAFLVLFIHLEVYIYSKRNRPQVRYKLIVITPADL